MINSFFDPLKNAKIIGLIAILLGLIDFLKGFKTINNFVTAGYPFFSILTNDFFIAFFLLLQPIIETITGFGLYKNKLWGIYLLGIFTILHIFSLIWAANDIVIKTSNYLTVGIYIALFIWFYSNKKQFSKK